MNKRPLGNTGMMVSEIGFGAFQIGDENVRGQMTEKEAIYLVHTSIDMGCNFFDTAPLYGSGRSEELLGKALSGRRTNVMINTKCGHYAQGEKNFDTETIKLNIEKSLRRLQTDYVDSLILHNPPPELLAGDSPHYDLFERLKQEGKIRAYGASLDWSEELITLMNETGSQVIEVLFNIFHQEPKAAFSMAGENGVGLIVKVPFDSGWLSGKYNRESTFTDIRSRWTPAIKARREVLFDNIRFIADSETTYIQAALRFILSFKEISTVIPGFKSVEQLQECFAAAKKRMPGETVQKLQDFWFEELKDNPLPW
jgi:aryl-alcohol dehydrogenase-like predicted oxidoreductase